MGRYREVHTEKDERRYSATIWWALWAVCFGIMVYTVWMQYSEYSSIKGTNSVVAKYTSENGQERASFMDEDNKYHSFDITGMGAKHDGDSIVLYYTDDIYLAQPRIGASTWIRSYVIFGVGLILISIKLILVYKTDHSVYNAGNSSTDE